ncbi:NADP-dependent oxidoreductase [Aspergillus foveolatus]|uniref:NADP-dependent oxidoreductase n=1 Tax=Aspergillus foveolatus TaxID=210207 RepID=UPI003CCDC046
MKAIRLHPNSDEKHPYSPSNPAPASALHLDTIPIPKPGASGELLVQVKASTIIRDTLTWPETYEREYITPGNDFSGIVAEVYNKESKFHVGDEVFGMLATDRPGSWAEYAIVLEGEVALKPPSLTWEEAAALPLSGMTAFEALFVHAGVAVPRDEQALRNFGGRADLLSEEGKNEKGKRVLITGAAGAVGMYVVQLARLAGLHVVAATSSNQRNAEFLRGLGADETLEYTALQADTHRNAYDVVIDTVGGKPLVNAWGWVRDGGNLVSVDSSSFNFVEEHTGRGIARDGIKASFFIVEGGHQALNALARFAKLEILKVFVLDVYPLEKTREAYEIANGRLSGRGKMILSI